MKARRIVPLILLLLPSSRSIGQEPPTPSSVGATPPILFTEVTDEAGIDFRHSFGDRELSNIVEGTGPGVVFLDYNGDRLPDLYFLNGAWHPEISDNRSRELRGRLANALFRNNGDGTFTDVTEAAGVGDKGYGMGAAAADYDGDGDLDLYLANGAVLVPTFGSPSDARALDLFHELFGDRQVTGIPSRELAVGLGAVHSVTQQEPAATHS